MHGRIVGSDELAAICLGAIRMVLPRSIRPLSDRSILTLVDLSYSYGQMKYLMMQRTKFLFQFSWRHVYLDLKTDKNYSYADSNIFN